MLFDVFVYEVRKLLGSCSLGLAQRAETARTNLDAPVFSVYLHMGCLDVGHPATRRVVLRVAHVVAVAWLLAAYLAHCHLLFLALLLPSKPFTNEGFSSILVASIEMLEH